VEVGLDLEDDHEVHHEDEHHQASQNTAHDQPASSRVGGCCGGWCLSGVQGFLGFLAVFRGGVQDVLERLQAQLIFPQEGLALFDLFS